MLFNKKYVKLETIFKENNDLKIKKVFEELNIVDINNFFIEIIKANEKIKKENIIILMKLGLDLNFKDIYGENGLIIATKNGNLDTVKNLIELNIDLNNQNNEGLTALMWAAKFGHKDIIKELLNNKAEIKLKTKNDKNVFNFVKTKEIFEMINLENINRNNEEFYKKEINQKKVFLKPIIEILNNLKKENKTNNIKKRNIEI